MAYQSKNPKFNSIKTEGALDHAQIPTPPNPDANRLKTYFKADGKQYTLSSTGVETEIGAGSGGSGSGEINYISNPSAAASTFGWVATTPGAFDVSQTGNAVELPRENLTGTGLKFVATAGATGQSVGFSYIQDDADNNKMLKIKMDIKVLAGYVANDFSVVINDGVSDIYTEVIPDSDSTFLRGFPSNTNQTMTMKIVSNVAASTGIVISDIVVGPGNGAQKGEVIADKIVALYDSLTLTDGLSFTAGVLATINYSNNVLEEGSTAPLVTTGSGWFFKAPRRGVYSIRAGLILNDTAWLVNDVTRLKVHKSTNGGGTYFSQAEDRLDPDVAGSNFRLHSVVSEVVLEKDDRIRIVFQSDSRSTSKFIGTGSQIYNQVSIVELSNHKLNDLNIGANDVEYAFNTGTWDSDDTTSFQYGQSGQVITAATNLTNRRSKTVRFQTNIQPTDKIVVELQVKGVWVDSGAVLHKTGWITGGLRHGNTGANTLTSGIGWQPVEGSTTDINVVFGRYANTYSDSPLINTGWATVVSTDTVKWRVVKHRAGIPIGFGLADANNYGLVKKSDTFALGSVQQSILTLGQFQTEVGSGWVLMDGSNIAGSALAAITGNSTLPDATGRFLRSSGGNAAALGIQQADDNKPHNHVIGAMDSAGANASTGRFQFNVATTGNFQPNSNGTFSSGSTESRPINLTVNTFIKIN